MDSTGKRVVDPIPAPQAVEIPRMLIWKRTLLLGVVSISIGLEAGYLLGRSMSAKAGPGAGSGDPRTARPPVTQVRFLPIPDADPTELGMVNEEETLPAYMPRASDTPGPMPTPFGKPRPTLIRLENTRPQQSDKG